MLHIKTEIKDRVLIVDDTKTIVQILSVVLKKEGFDVISASSGEEALLLLETEPVDVVLMDIQMDNGIDGFETCRILKNTAKTKDIPVVFLTAFDDLETKVAGFEAGGVDFISKSFDKIEILTRVKSQVKLFKLQNSLKSGLAYIKAILDAEKQLVAIYDENLNLENYNQAFADIFAPSANFLISLRLSPYEKYASPASDEKLFEMLATGQLFKSRIEGAGGVFGIELTEARVLGDTKKILTISDISAHEVAKKQEMELLKFKERYHNAQEQDAFKKQKKIIQDEVSHLFKNGWLFDSYYRPLDILSGDTFGAIKINDDRYLFYIVDAMGKGLSASVTSIQSTSFINNSVDQAIERGDFKLEDVIKPFCHFIKKQLLSDELLCIVFLDFDMKNESIKIANYGMPPILLETADVIRNIKPNNAPIMSFFSSDIIDDISLKDVIKIALYSDGLNEAACNDDKPYSNSIDTDFRESTLIREFLKAFESKTSKLDDDVTLIFISKPSMKNFLFKKTVEINSTISEIVQLNKEAEKMISSADVNIRDSSEAMLVFSELLMNAFEHGALNLTPIEKQRLLSEDKYEEFLNSYDDSSETKKIVVGLCVAKIENNDLMLEVGIEDPGDGFEYTEAFKSMYFKDNTKFSGRGIWMANDLADGVFFNERGNKTTFFKKLQKKSNSFDAL